MAAVTADELKYRGLMPVRGSALRARYNRALQAIVGRTSALAAFHIDMTGFSPEVAEELGDPLYLNPHGVNRKFILLTPEQESLPVVDANFSWTRTVLGRFIDDNRNALFALTSRDVVYGELDNSTYRLGGVEDLLTFRQVRVEIATSKKIASRARALRDRIERFKASESAWYDEAELDALIDLARNAGDVFRYPVDLVRTKYDLGNFFTRHFGGLYVFGQAADPALIGGNANFGRKAGKAGVGLERIVLSDWKRVRDFLGRNRLIEYATADNTAETLGELRHLTDLIVLDYMAQAGKAKDLHSVDAEKRKRFVYKQYESLPRAFHALVKVIRHMEQTGGSLPARVPNAAFFYLVRARDPDQRDLVEHLLANFTPLDFRRTYRFNQWRFFKQFANWPQAKRDYVADYLTGAEVAGGRHKPRKRAAGRSRGS